MTGVIEALRTGPATIPQLMMRTHLSADAVEARIRRANKRGHRIVNARRPGARGIYWLQHDHDGSQERRCAAEGCETVLSESNGTAWCRRHLPGVALLIYIELVLAEEGGESDAEPQLAIALG